MITIEDFLKTVDFRITSGSEYTWQCFGVNARYLDSEVQDRYSASIVFDSVTQLVYEATVCDYAADHAYRWTNPDYQAAYKTESIKRSVNSNQAWDNVDYTDLDVTEDFLTKAAAIVAGESYDTRVTVPLELSDDEMLRLMTMAHEQDITLNQLVEQILTLAIQAQKEQIKS
jgi:hypothetical protein